MRDPAISLASVCIFFVLLPAANAQQFVVQEPSLETFGVGTTVSVPDRGRASVGGVRQSAPSRAMYGPFRTGHSLGMSSHGSGLNIQARVHDLAELDRATLEAAENARRAREDYSLSPAAQHAYEVLRARPNVPDAATGRLGTIGAKMPRAAEINANQADGPSAEKLLDRAREAEAVGKQGLALAYRRAARARGSTPAQKETLRLSREDR
jgi:hypothetical protein